MKYTLDQVNNKITDYTSKINSCTDLNTLKYYNNRLTQFKIRRAVLLSSL